MQRLNLINTLKSFTPKELREFGEFVHSPFFNKNQGVKQLFDYLKKFHPDFDSDKLKKEIIYRKIFSKAEYNDGFMKSLIHKLSQLSEKFLFYQNIQNKTALEKLFITEEFNKRKLKKQFLKTLSDTEQEIENVKTTNSEYYYYRYLFHCIQDEYIEWGKFNFGNRATVETISLLTHYFFEKIFSTQSQILFDISQRKSSFDEILINELTSLIQREENDYIKNPIIKMHLYEILLITKTSDEYFYILKDILINEGDKLPNDKKFFLNDLMQNYCISKIYTGEKEYLKQRFELNRIALEKGFYKLDCHKYFDPVELMSMTLSAIRVKEYEWVEKFLDKYGEELPNEHKEIVIAFCKGSLNFAKKEFEKALELVNSVKSMVHVPYKVILRNLLLMIYYELSYFEQGEYLLASYRKFISTNEKEFTPERYERQQNFLKYYSRLLKIKEKNSTPELADIIVALKKNLNVLESDWLMEKALELEK